MILDLCEKWTDYAYGKEPVWAEVFGFLASLKPDCECGRYDLSGNNDLFALVQAYDTRELSTGKLEAHRKFIDIQTLLAGSERMFYGAGNVLEPCADYNADNDAAFYRYAPERTVEYVLTPGVFTVFFPGEGHMPGIALLSGSAPVKKTVIKIAAELLR
ncbi:MAG: YhcH/YjgK/YiaL family protein [Victivallaceae bacterium]|nr:YhcH/YjgK/YiaL family protein [Victivallaceae bacterium]